MHWQVMLIGVLPLLSTQGRLKGQIHNKLIENLIG